MPCQDAGCLHASQTGVRDIKHPKENQSRSCVCFISIHLLRWRSFTLFRFQCCCLIPTGFLAPALCLEGHVSRHVHAVSLLSAVFPRIQLSTGTSYEHLIGPNSSNYFLHQQGLAGALTSYGGKPLYSRKMAISQGLAAGKGTIFRIYA